MNNYNIEKEKQRHNGKVIEEKHGEGTFLKKSALSYVIDAHDDYLGSVELSRYGDLGYYEIVNFNLPDTVDILDLTWMDPDDVFAFDSNEQFQSIREIKANIDNLGYSRLPYRGISNYGIKLTVNGSETKSNIIEQIKGFREFLTKHFNELNGVKLEGFSPVVEKLLEVYAKRIGISVDKQVIESEKQREY